MRGQPGVTETPRMPREPVREGWGGGSGPPGWHHLAREEGDVLARPATSPRRVRQEAVSRTGWLGAAASDHRIAPHRIAAVVTEVVVVAGLARTSAVALRPCEGITGTSGIIATPRIA